MQQNTRPQWNLFSIFIVFTFFLVSPELLLAQDPCSAKKEFDDATTEAIGANHKIVQPVKPTGDDSESLNKSLKTANEAKDKTEKTKNDDESALRQANEGVTKFDNDLQKGKKLTTLKSEITTLESNIKKAQEANAKISLQDRMEVNNFKLFEVKPLQDAITMQMPGLSLDDAKEKAGDLSYEGFSNTEIDKIRQEIKQNQDLIRRTNDKYDKLTATPNDQDAKQIQDAENAIALKTPALKTAIENCRKNVIGNLSALRKKEQEYKEKLEKLYPDEKARKLMETLPEMQSELRTKKQDEKILSDEQKKLQDAVKQAKEKFEGGTKDGKSYSGSKKAFEEDEKKVKAIETNLKNFEDYDKKDKTWADAEKKKNDADKKVKDKETAYNTVVNEKNTALTNAQAAAALNTLDTRLTTVNRTLVNAAKKEVLEDPNVIENKRLFIEKINKLQAVAEKEKVRLQWKRYITKLVRPLYVRKRNEAEATRLRTIRDDATLQKFNCFSDVATFINLLGQTAVEVENRRASLVSDIDSGMPTGEDEQIPIEPIPTLDENEGKETPTDEVPEDIVKNTSEVKVFNVRPGQWLSTGIQLKKGQNFSITAKGLVTREKVRTWGPDGYYFIGFMAYTLKALVGDKLFEIGSDGSGTAQVDGVLKLGITSTYEKIGPGDSKLQGSFVATVTIDGK